MIQTERLGTTDFTFLW